MHSRKYRSKSHRWKWASVLSADECPGRDFYCLYQYKKAPSARCVSPLAASVASQIVNKSRFNQAVQVVFVQTFAHSLQSTALVRGWMAASRRVQPRSSELGGACLENEPSVSIHVRHGDACNVAVRSEGPRDAWKSIRRRPCCEQRACVSSLVADPWPVYNHYLYYLHELYGICRVYLATDDAKVLEEARRDKRFEWHTVETDRSTLNTQAWIEERQVFRTETVSAVLDGELLAQGDMIIGSLGS